MTHDKHETKSSSKSQEKKIVEEKKKEKDSPPTKVVIRRLPPSLTPETFLEQVSPVPKYDFFYFVKADMSLGQNAFSRAYINFLHSEEMYNFRDRFDGYIFVDGKGNEYPAIVEFSPYQKVPKKKAKKPDSKKGTLEQDADYQKFLEALQNPEAEPTPTIESYLEEIEQRERELKANHGCMKQTTPLIEYIKRRREDKKVAIQKVRDDRKRRELERRRLKEEDKRKRKEKEKIFSLKEKEKSKDKQKDVEGSTEEISLKVLKNPNRDRESDSGATVKGKHEKELGRESLRFSKENRERERVRNERQKDSERHKSPREAGRGLDKGCREESYEHTRSNRDDRAKREYLDDRKRPVRDRRDDHHSKSGHGKKSDSYYDDRPPRKYQDERKRSSSDRYDDRPRSSSDRRKDAPQSSSSSKRDAESSRPDRERLKGDNQSDKRKQDTQSAKTPSTSPVKCIGLSSSQSAVKTTSQSAARTTSQSAAKSVSQSPALVRKKEDVMNTEVKNIDKDDSEEKKKKRRDRPERQIYVPRRAREKQEVGGKEGGETKEPVKEGQEKGDV